MVRQRTVSRARSLVWALQVDGWSEREAGNLVAVLNGLRPSRSGWSDREIEHLRWVRALVRSGRVTS
jgi:hypothetical protein